MSPRNSSKVVASFDFLNEYYDKVMERLENTDSSSYNIKNGSNRICHMKSILDSSDSLLCRACVDDNNMLQTSEINEDLDLCLDEIQCDAEKEIIHKYLQNYKNKRKKVMPRQHKAYRQKERLKVIDDTIGLSSNIAY